MLNRRRIAVSKYKIGITILSIAIFFGTSGAKAENISLNVEKEPTTISENYAAKLFEIGKRHYESKKYETAIAYFLEAERVSFKKSKGKTGMISALFTSELWENSQNYFYLGHAYRDSGNHKDAIVSFEKVTRLDPENYEAYLFSGEEYIATESKGNGGKATEACKKAIKIKEDLMKAYVCIANGAMMNNGRIEAEKALTKAITINPGFTQGYEMLIKIHEGAKKPEKAEKVREMMKKAKGN